MTAHTAALTEAQRQLLREAQEEADWPGCCPWVWIVGTRPAVYRLERRDLVDVSPARDAFRITDAGRDALKATGATP